MKLRFGCYALFVMLLAALGAPVPAANAQSNTLPAELSDAEFWRIVSSFSEPDGPYPYDNFVSNERKVQLVIPALKALTKPGGVYLGVGPEQNFTYIAALQPKIAFILDIRRQNMLELLMYKALFEISPNRAEFVSRLFSRRRPPGVDEKSSPEALFAAFEAVKPDEGFHLQNLQAIRSSFTKHGFQLTAEDLVKIDYVYNVFLRGGPAINYAFASPGATSFANSASYARIMTDTDAAGRNWAYLANEENFQFVREMQRKNLIVPLVGNFAGPAAIRNVAKYLKEHNAPVTAFYVSNVESYLDAQQTQRFYSNAVDLPIDASSLFIRLVDGNHTPSLWWWTPAAGNQQVLSPMMDLAKLLGTGRRPSFDEVLRTIPEPGPALDLGTGPLLLMPKGTPAPAGYTLIGTTKQTIQLLDGSSRSVDLDVYTRK
jgi:hypothetical protein